MAYNVNSNTTIKDAVYRGPEVTSAPAIGTAKPGAANIVNMIYNLKGQWEEANKSGDTAAKNAAASKAQKYYEQLRSLGYSDVANELASSNYTQAKAVNDKWTKMGKTATRDYLYSLGKSYGMTSSDVDKLISWDGQTGEVSFGGKKIGRPDAVVDGVSYWSDTGILANAFNDYINRSGTTRTTSTAINQENENLFARYNQEYEDIKNTNPFETETGKAILAKYDLAGLQGRDNEVASGASSNGGNIDSFAAANALRQQSALINQGQMAVLEAHNQKVEHARALLSDMGVNIDRVFNQDETSKNNDVARKSEIAAVTGYVPDEWAVSNNPYMNEDGTIKNEYKDVDFSAVMANAKAAGNTEAYNAAAVARYYKIMGDYGKYGKFDDGNYSTPGQQKTETARQFDEQMKTATSGSSSKTVVSSSGTKTNKPTLTAAQAADAVKRGETSQAVIDAYNYYYGTDYTTSNPPKIHDTGAGPALSESEVASWVEYLNKTIADKYGTNYRALTQTGKNTYKRADADADFIIIEVFGSDDLTQAQKEYLLYNKFGITKDQVNAALSDPHYSSGE